jgi:hypothetical protein
MSLTRPEAYTQGVMTRRIARQPCTHVEWHDMASAPRDGTVIRALVRGREVDVYWTRTPHLPLVGWCVAGTQTPCEPHGWREGRDDGECE